MAIVIKKKPKKLTPAETRPKVDTKAHVRKILDENHHDPTKQIDLQAVVVNIVSLAQIMSEKEFYPYQTALSSRIVESVLLHDGEVLTALISRQSGKTQTVGSTVAAMITILPFLCEKYPESWHLNITDEKGTYRGFKNGIEIGIYAPRREQAKVAFDRVKECFEKKASQEVLAELGVEMTISNGNTVKLSNGSLCKSESASEQSKIEGETYHFLVLEEVQDISDLKIRKSLHPMVSSTMGTILKVGTSKAERCDFYTAIKENMRREAENPHLRKNNFIFPYQVCQKYNSRYKDYIAKEKSRIGEDSDEFKMSYECKWIFERGMFITANALLNPHIAQIQFRPFNQYYLTGDLPVGYRHYSIVAGIDWGSANDSTVLCLVAVDWKNPVDTDENKEVELYRKHVLGWVEWIGDDYEQQWGEINEFLAKVRNLSKIIMDTNTCGRPIYHRFLAKFAGSNVSIDPFNFSAKVKSEGYRTFSQDLSGKRFTFPACKEVRQSTEYKKFIHQMLDLRKKYQNGLMMVAHPDEKHAHDDYPDATMMACVGASTPSAGFSLQYGHSNPFYS